MVNHIDKQEDHHQEVIALKDQIADLRVIQVGNQIVSDLAKRIEDLLAERQNYITNANLEINHRVGVYDGQITEAKRVIDLLIPKPSEPTPPDAESSARTDNVK